MTPEHRTARALAHAFLADGAWTAPDLLARGRQVLDQEPEWLPGLAESAATAWRDAPRDAPGELTRYLLAVRAELTAPPPVVTGPDDDDAEPATEPPAPEPRVTRWVPAATRMGRTRWPVHPLDDLADVAELLATDLDHLSWYADPLDRQRREPAGHLHLYRRYWRTRRAGSRG